MNGISGFVPASLRALSGHLTTPGWPFPGPEAQAALRRVYPLRYLVVRLGDPAFREEGRPHWIALRGDAPPLLRFRGRFGSDDLYELAPLPERGLRIEREVSYDFLRRHPVLRAALRPLGESADLEHRLEVTLNGRVIERGALDGDTRLRLTLAPPYRPAAPQLIAIHYRYRRPAAVRDARYRIGTTGASSPGDLRVVSVGEPYGSASAVQLDGVDLSPDDRGYNLVALDASGRLLEAVAFDTFLAAEASRRLERWVAALPAGTIVAGAVQDEGSRRLTAGAVQALRDLGVAGDLRGRFREAHAFVGVKGAPPGSALEALGPRPLELVVGRRFPVTEPSGAEMGLELTEFELEAPAGVRR